MGRIRTVKPELPQSETLGRCSREARLLFILLWTIADDAGRCRGNSRMLASLLYPYDDDARGLMDGWLGELEHVEAIRRYEVGGDQYLDIPNWLKHQKIDRPSPPKYPSFDEGSRAIANPREDSLPEGKGRERIALAKARECSRESAEDSRFDVFWKAYPKKEAKQAALKAWQKQRCGNGNFDSIMGALEIAKRSEQWTKDGVKFIPHAATWLNGRRWEDEALVADPASAFDGVV